LSDPHRFGLNIKVIARTRRSVMLQCNQLNLLRFRSFGLSLIAGETIGREPGSSDEFS